MAKISSVYDINGQAQAIGELLGSGGEGSVFSLLNKPNLAVKRYHGDVLEKHRARLEAKVEAQIAMYSAVKHLPLAWPRLSIYDSKGQWVGYAMSRASGSPMRYLAHPALQKKHFPAVGRRQIANWLIRLLSVIFELHQQNVILGDINLNNILLEPNSSEGLWLIDCDSMQVTTKDGTHYPCLVGTAEFTAPEHQNQNFEKTLRTSQSDLYSLAILMFQCFMLGRHPFDQIDGALPAENMRRGHFPYGKNGIRPGSSGGIPVGPWYLMWSWLSYGLKDCFCRTFREGSHDPAQRPDIHQWLNWLEKYRFAIGKPEYGLVDTLRPAHEKLIGKSGPA